MEEESSNKSTVSHRRAAPKLCNPFSTKWVVVPREVDQQIHDFLKSTFAKYRQCLRKIKTKAKLKKLPNEEERDSLTEEEQKQKQHFRSWFVVGLNEVLKNLEKDRVRLVLVSKETQPAVLKTAVLELVARQKCAAACTSDLLSSVKESWPAMSSLTSLGVLRSDVPNDFDELVDYVHRNVPAVNGNSKESASQQVTMETDTGSPNKSEKKETNNKTLPENSVSALMSIDASKYYIYKNDADKNLKFEGQNFIGLEQGKNHIKTSYVQLISGVKCSIDDDQFGRVDKQFGIKPNPLRAAGIEGVAIKPCSDTKRKRKLPEVEACDYKSITIREMVGNKKAKKPKKQKIKKK